MKEHDERMSAKNSKAKKFDFGDESQLEQVDEDQTQDKPSDLGKEEQPN